MTDAQGSLAPLSVNRGHLTVLSDGDCSVLYNGATQAVSAIDFPITPRSADELMEFLQMLAPEEDANFMPSVPMPAVTPAFAPLLGGKKSIVSRLTLNIANACNLWCSYCYADHGNYHSPSSLMPADTAVAAVKRCLDLYSGISMVHFFGGEPLLNPVAIQAVCDFLRSELGVHCPSFVATTNGTVLTPELESLLVENSIALTMSVDGPAPIHD